MLVDKSRLQIGERLQHDKLGEVKFTRLCQHLETDCGEADTLYAEVNGRIQLLTLALVSKPL